MTTPIVLEDVKPELLVGVVEARDVPRGAASPELAAAIDAALVARAGVEPQPTAVSAAVRDLLRSPTYKPTGRGKPASEYLAQAASRGEWPRISHVVDALNLVSLESGLPISLLDADLAAAANGLVVRLGRAGEKYVFNAAGHEIDVEGLLSVCRADGPPLGNPVKDSMGTKTTPETRNVIALVWASRRAVDVAGLTDVCRRLAVWYGPSADVRVLTAS